MTLAIMGVTNPLWEWLIIPLALTGFGVGVGWWVRGLDREEPEPEFRQASHVRLLPNLYDWSKEPGNGLNTPNGGG